MALLDVRNLTVAFATRHATSTRRTTQKAARTFLHRHGGSP